jgi:hypothetical protein
MVVAEILLSGVRESSSPTDAGSASKSDDSSNGKGLDTQGRIQKHKDHSQKDGNFEALHFFVVFVCNIFYPVSYYLLSLTK